MRFVVVICAVALCDIVSAEDCVIAAFGNSRSNTKTATLSASADYKCPSYVDKNTPWLAPGKWGDKFRVTQSGNRVTVKRLDYSGGWGQNLRFKCCRAKVAQKCTIAAFGNSRSNTKTATLPSSIYKCPSYVDKNTPWLDPTKWGDKFRVTQSGNRVTVKRLDYSGGWGQNLRFKCCQAAGGTSSTSGGNGAVSGPMVNLARGSHYTAQSSVAYNGPSARAVDGNHNSKWGSNSITHTRTQHNPWWSVDFKKLVTVYRVKVWNRLDCCSSRLSGAQVYVVNGGQKHLIGTMPNMNGKGWYEVKTSGTVGTKVLIQIPGSNKILSLAEVEVWGRAGGNGNGNAKKCTIAAFGNSGSNTKTATLPSSIYKCPSYVDKNTPWLDPTKWGDKFRVTQVGNKVTVKRLDYHGGWGQNLRFKCCTASGPVNPCMTKMLRCFNGGTCKPAGTSYTCACKNGFSGTKCQTKPNPCAYPKKVTCHNGGTCKAKGNSYVCACKGGHTGKHCQTQGSKECKITGGKCTCNQVTGKKTNCKCEHGYMLVGDTCINMVGKDAPVDSKADASEKTEEAAAVPAPKIE